MPTSVPQPRSDSEIEIIFDNEDTGGIDEMVKLNQHYVGVAGDSLSWCSCFMVTSCCQAGLTEGTEQISTGRTGTGTAPSAQCAEGRVARVVPGSGTGTGEPAGRTGR